MVQVSVSQVFLFSLEIEDHNKWLTRTNAEAASNSSAHMHDSCQAFMHKQNKDHLSFHNR